MNNFLWCVIFKTRNPVKMTTSANYPMLMAKIFGFLFFFLFAPSISGFASGLRLTNMTAPVIQDPREDMQLFCEFDMGGEELYAVKWYKDDHEFFRYSPAGNQRLVQFQVMGVHVDLSRTKCTMTSCSLVLNELSRTFSSGAYRCEVSSEAPAFRLASQTHNITVAAIPENNPTIEGVNDSYLVGDLLVATCSSGLGDPKPVITWYINRKPAYSKSLKELPLRSGSYYNENDRVKLKSTTVQLRLPLDKKLTENKATTAIELTCIQSIDVLNSAIAPPRSSTKIIRVVTEEQLANNQKLYGVFGSGLRLTGISCTSIILINIIVKLILNH